MSQQLKFHNLQHAMKFGTGMSPASVMLVGRNSYHELDAAAESLRLTNIMEVRQAIDQMVLGLGH